MQSKFDGTTFDKTVNSILTEMFGDRQYEDPARRSAPDSVDSAGIEARKYLERVLHDEESAVDVEEFVKYVGAMKGTEYDSVEDAIEAFQSVTGLEVTTDGAEVRIDFAAGEM
jgi:hypothetical protein